jgi:hypothetical protein
MIQTENLTLGLLLVVEKSMFSLNRFPVETTVSSLKTHGTASPVPYGNPQLPGEQLQRCPGDFPNLASTAFHR